MAYEFNHLHLRAPDPEKTANWYVKAFDFRIIDDTTRDTGMRFIRCQTTDGTRVNISSVPTNETLGAADASPHWGLEHFGLNVDNLDAELERLKSLEVEVVDGPRDGPNGMRIAFIKVPGDVRIELMQLPR